MTSPMASSPLRSGGGWLDGLLPPNVDRVTFGMLLVGLAVLYVPTIWDLSGTLWQTDEYGHGPIILAVSLWLMYRKREALAALDRAPAVVLGSSTLGLGLVVYLLGRSQSIAIFEVGSPVLVVSGLLLMFRGKAGLRLMLFPVLFMLFMVPLPGIVAAAITAPLKSAVSAVASNILYAAGYPVGRAGVVLTVGQYQLLVADACAGLNSMFSLEALGLLYMNLMNYKSVVRNTLLAVLIIPISFCANVVRVMILVLVTYYFGDEAGQGFVHGFAGMVLFIVALTLMFFVDKLLGLAARGPR